MVVFTRTYIYIYQRKKKKVLNFIFVFVIAWKCHVICLPELKAPR